MKQRKTVRVAGPFSVEALHAAIPLLSPQTIDKVVRSCAGEPLWM